jgi:hypothetical protein
LLATVQHAALFFDNYFAVSLWAYSNGVAFIRVFNHHKRRRLDLQRLRFVARGVQAVTSMPLDFRNGQPNAGEGLVHALLANNLDAVLVKDGLGPGKVCVDVS